MDSLFENIRIQEKFQSCVDLLNKQDLPIIEQLIRKVFEFETYKRKHVNSKAELTDAEKMKLSSVFTGNPTLDLLELSLSLLSRIVCDCVYHIAKPNLVLKRLVEEKFSVELATCFSTLWLEYAKDIVSAEKTRSALIAAENPVTKVEFSINASNKEPTAIFKFQTEAKVNLFVEANSSELFVFYQELEKIQAKLDSLK